MRAAQNATGTKGQLPSQEAPPTPRSPARGSVCAQRRLSSPPLFARPPRGSALMFHSVYLEVISEFISIALCLSGTASGMAAFIAEDFNILLLPKKCSKACICMHMVAHMGRYTDGTGPCQWAFWTRVRVRV